MSKHIIQNGQYIIKNPYSLDMLFIMNNIFLAKKGSIMYNGFPKERKKWIKKLRSILTSGEFC